MREIAAGAAYRDTVPREKERMVHMCMNVLSSYYIAIVYYVLSQLSSHKNFIMDMRTPKPLKKEKSTSNDGDDQCLYNPSMYLPPLVHTASSKGCLTSQRPAQPHSQKLPDDKNSSEKKFLDSSETSECDGEVREGTQCPRVGPNIYVAVAAAQFRVHFSHHGKKKEIRYALRVPA